jgi:uncharacterized paraquat-inducible protein A
MKTCPTCYKTVAKNAGSCPSCGHRFRSAAGFLLQWVIAIVVIALAVAVFLHFAG